VETVVTETKLLIFLYHIFIIIIIIIIISGGGCSLLNVCFCAVSVIGLLAVDAAHKNKELLLLLLLLLLFILYFNVLTQQLQEPITESAQV
jgi:hypothetical protein